MRSGAGRWIAGGLAVAGGIAAALALQGKLHLPALPGGEPDAGDDAAPSARDGGSDARLDASRKKERPQTAPLSSAQLGAPLVHGAFVTACGAPATMKVVVKVSVRMGRAVDVDVQTDPPDTGVARCVDQATRDLRWDVGTRTDQVTVRY